MEIHFSLGHDIWRLVTGRFNWIESVYVLARNVLYFLLQIILFVLQLLIIVLLPRFLGVVIAAFLDRIRFPRYVSQFDILLCLNTFHRLISFAGLNLQLRLVWMILQVA